MHDERQRPGAWLVGAISIVLPGAGHALLALAARRADDERASMLAWRGVGMFALSLCCLPGCGNLLAAIDAARLASTTEDEPTGDVEVLEPMVPSDDPYAPRDGTSPDDFARDRSWHRDDAVFDDLDGFLAEASTVALERALAGADPALRDRALYVAASNGHGHAARWLLDRGADPDTREEMGSALSRTLSHPDGLMTELLLAGGADPNVTDGDAPALVMAARRGVPRAVRALIGAGARLGDPDPFGFTARDRAELGVRRHPGVRSREVLRLLQAADAPGGALAELEATLRSALSDRIRPAWRPRVEPGEGPPAGSRFGGRPWLSDGRWPRNGEGEPMGFVAQVDLGATPEQRFGRGLLQLFVDPDAFPEEAGTDYVLRVVVPDRGGLGTPPPGAVVAAARRIVGWEALEELPHPDALEQDLPVDRELAFELLSDAIAYGDKLGGWPAWVQMPEHASCARCGRPMDQLVLQVDSGGNTPFDFGDVGCGYVLQCPDHPDALAWVVQSH